MNAHVISPSLKDFVRYQVGSEMSLLRKVLPWLCPFSASSTSEQEWELQALLPLGFLQEAALCTPGCSILQGFLYLGGVWCWELSHTGTAWAFQLETAHPELLALVPHHLLGNKPVFHWGMVWNRVTQKNPAWSTQLCPNCIAPSRNTTFPSSRKPGGCFGWHAGIEAGLGVKALDKNYSGAVGCWAFWLLCHCGSVPPHLWWDQ